MFLKPAGSVHYKKENKQLWTEYEEIKNHVAIITIKWQEWRNTRVYTIAMVYSIYYTIESYMLWSPAGHADEYTVLFISHSLNPQLLQVTNDLWIQIQQSNLCCTV